MTGPAHDADELHVADLPAEASCRFVECGGDPPRVSLRSVMAAVRRARENGGMAYAESAVVPDVAAVSAPLPEGIAPRTLVVSVGGPASGMRANRAFVEEELRAWLGRVARASAASRN